MLLWVSYETNAVDMCAILLEFVFFHSAHQRRAFTQDSFRL